MSDLAELIAHLRKDADFVDRDTYDGCWEVKETDRGKRLRQAATALSALVAERDALRTSLERVLLDVQFMWEDGTLPDRRDDIIYVAARAALAQGGEK